MLDNPDEIRPASDNVHALPRASLSAAACSAPSASPALFEPRATILVGDAILAEAAREFFGLLPKESAAWDEAESAGENEAACQAAASLTAAMATHSANAAATPAGSAEGLAAKARVLREVMDRSGPFIDLGPDQALIESTIDDAIRLGTMAEDRAFLDLLQDYARTAIESDRLCLLESDLDEKIAEVQPPEALFARREDIYTKYFRLVQCQHDYGTRLFYGTKPVIDQLRAMAKNNPRVTEIVRAFNTWQADIRRLKKACGYGAISAAYRHAEERNALLGERLAQTRPKSLDGLLLKTLAHRWHAHGHRRDFITAAQASLDAIVEEQDWRSDDAMQASLFRDLAGMIDARGFTLEGLAEGLPWRSGLETGEAPPAAAAGPGAPEGDRSAA